MQQKEARILSCSSVDLSSFLPPVGDQGVQGSCVSWVTAYYAKSFLEKKELGWSLNTANHQFSPQYVYSQTHASNVSGGGGSTFFNALNLIINQGVSTTDQAPYDPFDNYGFLNQPSQAARRQANWFRNFGWTALPFRDIDEIRNQLCNQELVLLGIPM